MHASSFFAIAAATLAAALPLELNLVEAETGSFNVTNFVFGCSVGCSWYFDVAVNGEFPNHPAVPTPVHCEGTYNDVDYVKCGAVSETQSVLAYIQKPAGILLLQYVNNIPGNPGATYRYFGNQTVYAATSENAALQKPDFIVEETRSTAVA